MARPAPPSLVFVGAFVPGADPVLDGGAGTDRSRPARRCGGRFHVGPRMGAVDLQAPAASRLAARNQPSSDRIVPLATIYACPADDLVDLHPGLSAGPRHARAKPCAGRRAFDAVGLFLRLADPAIQS